MKTTVIRIAAVAALALFQITLLFAQAPIGSQRSDPAVRTQAQELWDQYRQGAGKAGAGETLMKVLGSRALPATKENAASVLALAQTKVSSDEMTGLIRLAGSLVPELQDQTAKSEIVTFLSQLAMNTQDPKLGRVAALTYSRTGYYPDSITVLAHAHEKSYIGDDDYYGDLAHLLPAAPDSTSQSQIMKLLANANNGFSREVLASLLLDRRILNSLTPASASDALNLLRASEPTFSKSTSTIGGTDVIRYGYWMNAVVGLNAKITGQTEPTVMAQLMKVDGANPKVLIAVLVYEPNVPLVRSAFGSQTIQKIDSSIAAFAQQSKNGWVQELATQARANLAAPVQ